ncbi:MAG: galactitol-1-phosphate 5-dehydrogenase [Spirochaetales bacterium]|jgi:L-iditol 2-dehydrogenase|nr:galactitol-1-phosphate 5-dehydrogenase [Spirochaetales bacterium]
MKALVLEENAKLIYRDVPEPAVPRSGDESGWAQIKIDAAGICGSDITRGFHNGAYHYPLVMGHEFAGTVVETGKSGGTGPRRVAVFPLLPCRRCEACLNGDYAQCVDYDYLGSRRDGGFAEYVRVPEENLFTVPEHVSQEQAAMTEPCAVALHGVRKLEIQPNSTAVVLGGGPIGNLAAQWLRIRGCGSVSVIDIDKKKLEIAANMGFETAAQPDGADIAVEACGVPVTYRQVLEVAVRGGQVLFLGNLKGNFTLEEKQMSQVLRKELRIYGSWNSRVEPRGKDDWTVCLEYMGRGIDVDSLISHRLPLSEGPAIFREIYSRSEFHNKVILLPGHSR